ncbi:1,2-phenylacetyl-CoA epoxidase subunit PaaC [Nocardioides plantarum]|uniref:1,2-phenylacetyl-CoA epoxidase subunit PaaC n=1 Tax=Nocardioides plantarum TaxID=29299 RepID=A0ABV5KFN6_9ACTN|nr:1,2-phenylacetyl-CoA epoxidase subunit PaaC [Nocardioides plantarum]
MDSPYDGLLEHHDVVGDDSQWAFGTDFEDPLAGVDTTVPAGLDAAELAAYCLMLGDDALVLSHRLSEWCSNAPDLEEDIALANCALDLLGQARLLLARAAAADPSVVPVLPEGSPVPAEDALAFFREAVAFRCHRMVEVDNGDFAQTMVRLLLFSTVRLAAFEQLSTHADPVLSAIAVKGVKELSYHRDYAARWFVTLAQGTEESARRLAAGLDALWPLYAELAAAYEAGPAADVVLDQVLAVAGVERPDRPPRAGTGHTEALSRLLAEMQVVARAHPRGQW